MHTIFDKTFSKSARPRLAAASALAVALTLPGAAMAGSTAFSTLQITDGIFIDAATGTQLTLGTEISVQSLTSQFDLSANRSEGPGAAFSLGGNAVDTNFSNGINFADPAQISGGVVIADPCGGAGGQCGPIGQDNFSQQPLGTGEFSRAAGLKHGTGVLNTGGGIAGGPVVDRAASEIISQTSSVSSANTTATSTVGFTLIALADLQRGFTGNILQFAQAILDSEINSGNASGSSQFQFQITDSTGALVPLQVIAPVPTASTPIIVVGAGASATSPGASNSAGLNASVPLAFQTVGNLTAGETFDVLFSVTTQATLTQEIPEPAPLALLGLGLLAAAGVRRRRRLAA